MNGQSAYGSVAMALLAAGARSNVATAAAVAMMPYEASFNPVPLKAPKAIGPSTFSSCDGSCNSQLNS